MILINEFKLKLGNYNYFQYREQNTNRNLNNGQAECILSDYKEI